MPIADYSVLRGDPVSGRLVGGRSMHYRIAVNLDGGRQTQVDLNVQSQDGSEVLYLVDHAFTPPAPDLLAQLPVGFTPVASEPGGLALDFVRSQVNGAPMVQQSQFAPLHASAGAGRRNDLHNEVVDLLNRAIADQNGTLYIFGSSFSDPNGTTGIHNIHMNQGNDGRFARDNGTWQDGALLMNLPALNNTWIAVFIAFLTESWSTDDQTGNAV